MKKLGVLTTILAFACLLSAKAFADDTLAPDKSTPARISVTGQVVDPEGKPLAGARVVLREWSSLRYSENAYSDDVSDILAETTTDSDGHFHFDGVEARPFNRFASYKAPWDLVAFSDGYGLTWLHLPRAESTQPVTLKMHAAREIEGRLIDKSGQPIPDCDIEVSSVAALNTPWHTDYNDPAQLILWRSKLAPKSKTDNDGRFKFTNLPADERLSLMPDGPAYARVAIHVATTNDPQPPIEQPEMKDGKQAMTSLPVYLTGFTRTLEPGGQVRGSVVFADTDEPAADTKVDVSWQNQAFFAIADAKGQFEFTSLPGSKYYLSARSEEHGYLSDRELIEFSSDAMERDVVLKLPRGETVSGSVVDADSGAGVAGVEVVYMPAEEPWDSGWTPSRPAKTNEAGNFEIFVPAGNGQLRVGGGIERHPTHDIPDFWRWQQKEHVPELGTTTIKVTPGQPLEGVHLSVSRGLIVRGQAVDADGQPISNANVEALDRFGRPEFTKRGVTDADGRFELSGFPPYEELHLKIADASHGLRGSAEVAADDAAGASRVADVGAVTLQATAKIAGVVLGDGKPLSAANVHLSLIVHHDDNRTNTSQQQVVVTDQDGRYIIDNVDADKEIMLWVELTGYTDATSSVKKLTPNESLEIPTIELRSRDSFVSGIVVDLDGKPIAGVTVNAWERNGYASIAYGRRGPPPPSGADGRFRLDQLPNAPLKLMAYIQPPAGSKDRSARFPAWVDADPGQTDIRIVLDPKLQRPLPSRRDCRKGSRTWLDLRRTFGRLQR